MSDHTDDQVRLLVRRLETVQETERTEIARELHDELGQSLTILRMDLGRLRNAIGAVEPLADRLLTDMGTLIDVTLQRVRSLSVTLHPTMLEDLGLDAATQTYVQHFARRTGLKAMVDVRHATRPLDPARALTTFRVLRECLTNVARHARASQVAVTLVSNADEIMLEVSDDGRGIDREHIYAPESLGLFTMRERAAEWGGTFRVSRRPGPTPGTTVTLRLPVKSP
jgi:signal transduction histidine kinase